MALPGRQLIRLSTVGGADTWSAEGDYGGRLPPLLAKVNVRPMGLESKKTHGVTFRSETNSKPFQPLPSPPKGERMELADGPRSKGAAGMRRWAELTGNILMRPLLPAVRNARALLPSPSIHQIDVHMHVALSIGPDPAPLGFVCILYNHFGRPRDAVIINAWTWTTERLAPTQLYVLPINFVCCPILHPPSFSFPDPPIQFNERFDKVARNKK